MKFHCQGCQATFTVPDERIPKGKTPRVPCPKCRTLMEPVAPPQTAAESRRAGPHPIPPEPGREYNPDEEEGVPLDMVEEGVKTALLCITDLDRLDFITQTLEQLDFFVVAATRAPLALAKLNHNRYDLMILDEAFEKSEVANNLVLYHVQLLPMHVRRGFFLCLLTDTLPTMDRVTAYRIGVDMTLNMKDLENVKLILAKAMKEHKNFYAVFTDELSRKGHL